MFPFRNNGLKLELPTSILYKFKMDLDKMKLGITGVGFDLVLFYFLYFSTPQHKELVSYTVTVHINTHTYRAYKYK